MTDQFNLNSIALDALKSLKGDASILADVGIAIGLVNADQPLELWGHGQRDREKGLPVTPDTLFDLCSLTKAFTAAVFVQSHLEGDLSIDAPLNGASPLLPLRDQSASQAVSIRDLLTHRTGTPSNNLVWYFGDDPQLSVPQALSKLESVPGAFRSQFLYNNLAYGALGSLMQSLTGESVEGAIERRILQPLNMHRTGFKVFDRMDNQAIGYNGLSSMPALDMTSVGPAGALRGTVSDLALWIQYLLNPHTTNIPGSISSDCVRLVQVSQIAVPDPDPVIMAGLEWLNTSGSSYGLGWFVGTAFGERALFHPGLADGFSNVIVILPERRLGLAVLTNQNLSRIPGQLAHIIIAHLLNNQLPVERSKPSQSRDPHHPKFGVFWSDAYGHIELRDVDGRSELRFRDQSWIVEWTSDSEGAFSLSAFGMNIQMRFNLGYDTSGYPALHIPFALNNRVAPECFSLLDPK